MPRRKRRFESLEERRLLAALVGAPSPVASSDATPAQIAPPSAAAVSASAPSANTAAASSSDRTEQVDSGPNGDATDDDAEYATPQSPLSAGNQAASSVGGVAYPSPGDTNSYDASSGYNDYTSNEYANPYYSDATKSPTSSHAGTQPTTANPNLLAVAALSENSSGGSQTSLGAQASLPGITGSGGASAGAVPVVSPPAVRSPSPIDQDLAPAVASSGAADGEEGVGTQSDLAAPVVLAGAQSDWRWLTARAAAVEEFVAQARELAPTMASVAGEPLTGAAAAHFAVDQRLDDVFDQLGRLGDRLIDGAGAIRFAQWLVVAGGACAAFEYARARYREGGTWQVTSFWPVPYEPRLPRRWFGRRRAK
ncbi:MAG TPA: hypothetical protein VHC22_27725 [Pirellulales bacterium]|nr:hypothetical protein [Pirellulales bacterium]